MDDTTDRQPSELSDLSGRYKGETLQDVKNIPDRDQEPASPADEKVVYPSTLKASVIVSGLFLASFLVALDQTIISTAIPKITDQFKSVTDVGWYGSAYFLTSTGLQPTFGRIYKIFNVSEQENTKRLSLNKKGLHSISIDQMVLSGGHFRL